MVQFFYSTSSQRLSVGFRSSLSFESVHANAFSDKGDIWRPPLMSFDTLVYNSKHVVWHALEQFKVFPQGACV